MASPAPAQAVLTRDGVVVGVGKREELKQLCGKGVRVVELPHGALLPAFLDSHSHLTAYAQTLAYADLTGCSSWEEMARRLRRQVEQTQLPPHKALIGFGYDQNLLPGGKHPGRELFSLLDLPHPVVLTHQSGHVGVLNQRAMEQAGLGKGTPDMAGGIIQRDGQGNPTGYLEEQAFFHYSGKLGSLEESDWLALLGEAQRRYLSQGIGLIQEGLTGEKELALLEKAELLCDVVCYVDLARFPRLLEDNLPLARNLARKGKRGLRIGGYKIILDGSPQGRTAWMSAPYLGSGTSQEEPGYRGYPVYSDQQVMDFLRHAARQGQQLLCHCNGDAAAQQLIRCMEQVSREYPVLRRLRVVMIHAQFLRADQLQQVKQLGMVLSFFPSHIRHWGGRSSAQYRLSCSVYQPRRFCAGPGDPFHLPPGYPGFAPRFAGSGLVRRQPPHQPGDLPGALGAGLRVGCSGGDYRQCGLSIWLGGGNGHDCPGQGCQLCPPLPQPLDLAHSTVGSLESHRYDPAGPPGFLAPGRPG